MDFRTDKLLHGGDYNPEQWLKRPDILEKDIDMLEESGCNVVSLGIFSWSTLEPEEGVFHFGWLQEIIDKLYKRGISTILATPSGARPKWMADKYPEVLRVDETRQERYLDSDIIIVILLLFTERRYILLTKSWHRRLPHIRV